MRRFLWIGLAVWFAATLALRVAGQFVVRAGDSTRVAVVFGVTAMVIVVFLARLVRSLPTPEAGLRAGVFIVLPGLLLDTGSVLWFRAVFPNLPASSGMLLASLLMWAYGVALLAAVWPRKAPS